IAASDLPENGPGGRSLRFSICQRRHVARTFAADPVAGTAVSRIDLLASHDCFLLAFVRVLGFLCVSRRIMKGPSLRVPHGKGSSREETKNDTKQEYEVPPSGVGEASDRIGWVHSRSQ